MQKILELDVFLRILVAHLFFGFLYVSTFSSYKSSSYYHIFYSFIHSSNVILGTKIDCWALGVITFSILAGYPPFYGETNQEVFRKILNVDYSFDETYWANISEEAKDMIRHLLVPNQQERWSVEDALNCEWIKSLEGEGEEEKNVVSDLSPNKEKLKEYNAKRKMKAAIYAVIGIHSLGRLD